ncbi:hypothetical protein C8R46DRAFT_267928 [Mycena filopes]|nr:hypothetical protein C8R46DRAFT_267928 [Mycena filopes]
MLNVLFAHCTPTIRTLDLRYVTVDDVASSSQAPVSAAKIQIKELRLPHTGGIAEWFAAPQCPVDLGHLRHLDTHMSTSPGMALLLQSASTTIEELHVHTYDLEYGLSLHSFPALTKLHLVSAEATPLVATLVPASGPHLQLAHLQCITLVSPSFQAYEQLAEGQFGPIDVALADLPALERVTLKAMLPPVAGAHNTAGEASPAEIRAALVGRFPRLSARGLLAIHVEVSDSWKS